MQDVVLYVYVCNSFRFWGVNKPDEIVSPIFETKPVPLRIMNAQTLQIHS